MSYEADRQGKSTSSDTGIPEALGLGGIAILAMALLAFGYNVRGPSQTAEMTKDLQAPAAAEQPMSTPPQPRASPAEKSDPPTSVTSPPAGGTQKN